MCMRFFGIGALGRFLTPMSEACKFLLDLILADLSAVNRGPEMPVQISFGGQMAANVG